MSSETPARFPCFRCVTTARRQLEDGAAVIGVCNHAKAAFTLGRPGLISIDVDRPKDAPRATRWLERNAPKYFGELAATMDAGEENAGGFYANPVRGRR